MINLANQTRIYPLELADKYLSNKMPKKKYKNKQEIKKTLEKAITFFSLVDDTNATFINKFINNVDNRYKKYDNPSLTLPETRRNAIKNELKTQILNTVIKNNQGKRAIWVASSSPNPRESHLLFVGQEFDLEKGIYDPDVGKNILPGELPNCKCGLILVD